MINYKSPERQRLVDNIIVAINKRNVAGMNLPWSCISYWIACSKVEKADEALVRHDRTELLNAMSRARKEYSALSIEARIDSPEERAYEDAIESYHEHRDAYGEVV